MELATKRAQYERLRTSPSTLRRVIDEILESKYLTVQVVGEDTAVKAVLIHPDLLSFLTDMYDHLCAAQAQPDWGVLRAEVRRFKRISAGLHRELARQGGTERMKPELWKEIQSSIFEALEQRQALWTEERDPVGIFPVDGVEG